MACSGLLFSLQPIVNNGIWTISEAEASVRLDRWLSSLRRLGSNLRALDTLNRGLVRVNGVRQTLEGAERILEAGDVIALWVERSPFARREFAPSPFGALDIAYEDRSLLLLNKPAGQLTTPHPYFLEEESLFDLAEEYLESKRQRAWIVHRIDRDTTGLVLFAKTQEAQAGLREQFMRREPRRVYHTLVYGGPKDDSGTWKNRITWSRKKRRFVEAAQDNPYGLDAISQYRVLERYRGFTYLDISLVTGKRNQIRLQADLHGCPLIGERIFNSSSFIQDSSVTFHRQALHAYQLEFQHPIRKTGISFIAPLPDDINSLLTCLRMNR